MDRGSPRELLFNYFSEISTFRNFCLFNNLNVIILTKPLSIFSRNFNTENFSTTKTLKVNFPGEALLILLQKFQHLKIFD